MSRERISRQELDADIAQTREVASRLSEALDRELSALADWARASGATTTPAAVDADLAAARARFADLKKEVRDLMQQSPAPEEFDFEAIHRFMTASRTIEQAAEKIAAEIQELEALRAELG